MGPGPARKTATPPNCRRGPQDGPAQPQHAFQPNPITSLRVDIFIIWKYLRTLMYVYQLWINKLKHTKLKKIVYFCILFKIKIKNKKSFRPQPPHACGDWSTPINSIQKKNEHFIIKLEWAQNTLLKFKVEKDKVMIK